MNLPTYYVRLTNQSCPLFADWHPTFVTCPILAAEVVARDLDVPSGQWTAEVRDERSGHVSRVEVEVWVEMRARLAERVMEHGESMVETNNA